MKNDAIERGDWPLNTPPRTRFWAQMGRGKGGGDEASDAERKPQSGRRIMAASFRASPPRHPSINEPFMMIVIMKMMMVMMSFL